DEGTDDDGFLLAIGEAGFEDDMESGQGGWTHSGTHDLWHLTDYRRHSGTYSWYCGTASHQYENDTQATLWSSTFVAPEDGELSFWCYFDVTIYGTDGLFVEALDDGDWQVLDYLGSGGALGGGDDSAPDSLLFACDWAEHVYDLSDLTPGSTTQVRFRFETDATDTDEGFYVDDVVVRGAAATTAIGGDGGGMDTGSAAPVVVRLSASAPNPALHRTRWHLALPAAMPVRARVYDIQGRLVARMTDGLLAGGDHVLEWNGLTARGARAPAGVYFLELRAGDFTGVRKVVRMAP
ncbi:MAG: FlgD immunoglobulin-like domain containing protein, partial [Candidatus Eiseniibacteriota bacterium]